MPTATERTVAISSLPVRAGSAPRGLPARRAAQPGPSPAPRAGTPCPAAVSRMPRGSRSMSWPPNSVSSALICCDSPGCDTCSSAAARVNEPVSTTATQYSSCRRFITADYGPDAGDEHVARHPHPPPRPAPRLALRSEHRRERRHRGIPARERLQAEALLDRREHRGRVIARVGRRRSLPRSCGAMTSAGIRVPGPGTGRADPAAPPCPGPRGVVIPLPAELVVGDDDHAVSLAQALPVDRLAAG